MLDFFKDQDSGGFYHKTPITCLTAVFHKVDASGKPRKKVITVLSNIYNHTASFVIMAIERMFKSDFLKDIETVRWWSDGGPHFKNKQLIWALLNEDPVLPGVSFEVNFRVSYHGKGEPDEIFGEYMQMLTKNLPQEGITSLQQLVTHLKFVSLQQASLFGDPDKEHEVIVFNLPRFDTIAYYLLIDQLKKYHSFFARDGKTVAKTLTGISDKDEEIIEMESDEKKIKGTPKRSTARIITE
ncbi:MAG: hypothetical protein EZS28_031684 [Streblomastix strix]|uniref:Uncharacterized protein n=1 Tax=Streblomastix strix TaxID=222440 RepID=A0A5J4UQT9_9EUKA|nr:MAG: hypothetical protein EZS28_031684 [Streblomastix strix]